MRGMGFWIPTGPLATASCVACPCQNQKGQSGGPRPSFGVKKNHPNWHFKRDNDYKPAKLRVPQFQTNPFYKVWIFCSS